MATGTELPAGEQRAMRRRPGWMIVARKELADHFHSVRLLILVALIGVAAIAAVLAAVGGIRDVAAQAGEDPALFLRLFTISPDRIPPFFILIGLLGPLLGIAFGFDAVNGERAQGTLPRLLSQPIYRDDVINGKFVAGIATIGVVLAALMLLVAGMGIIRLGITPTGAQAVRLVAFYVVALVYIGFWLAFATLTSVWLRRAATSALASIAAWLVTTLFAALLVGIVVDVVAPVGPDATFDEQLRNVRLEQTLSRVSPSTIYEEGTVAVLNPQIRSVGLLFPEQVDRAIPSPLTLGQSLSLVWPQVFGLIALTIVTFAVAYVSFMRQEVRA